MAESWIDVTLDGDRKRHTLTGALLRFGPADADVAVPDANGDELQLWTNPPKFIHVGAATTPLLNGRVFEEAALENGDTVQWAGAVLVFGREEAAVLEEIPPDDPLLAVPDAAPAPSAPSASATAARPVLGDEERAWNRMRAGLLVELGIADKKVARRWQESVLGGEFDADACAREILAKSGVPGDDPRVLERTGRLERDLLMMPLQRGIKGASRRARGAAKGGAAFLVANLIAILVYTLILVAIAMLMRVNYDFSFDGMIDRWLGGGS
ncbi:MAG: hypothetical protein GY711_01365 [bacterium]|nr:hypothetical protein [bacterium]